MSSGNSNFNPADFVYPDAANYRKNGANKLKITTTLPAASATIQVAQAIGCTLVVPSTATTPTYTLPTAAVLLASLKNVAVGSLLEIPVINLGSGTATLVVAGTSVTVATGVAVTICVIFTNVTTGSAACTVISH